MTVDLGARRRDPIPINFGNAGCAAMAARPVGHFESCTAEPELTGHVTVAQHVAPVRRGRYMLFVCVQHCDIVRDARPMTDQDRAELAERREQEALALAGKPFRRVAPVRRIDGP